MFRLLLAVLAVLCSVRLAAAQMMAVMVDSPDAHYFAALQPHEVRVIARILNLGDPEREAMMALYDGHCAALKARCDAIVEEREEKLEEAQALGDMSVASVPKETQDGWHAEGDRLRAAFFDDLKMLLSKEQADRWPLVERELRRFKSIRGGRLAGESLDVIRVVDENAPGAWKNQDAAVVLASYAVSIDGALARRDAVFETPEVGDFSKLCQTDKTAAERLWRDVMTLRVAVRDLNLKTAEQVAAMLGETEGEALRRAVFRAAFDKVARASRTETYVRAAAKLEPLSSEQQSEIASVMETFESRLDSVKKEQAALQREAEPQKKPPLLAGDDSGVQTATTADGNVIRFFSPAQTKPDTESPAYKLQEKRLKIELDAKRQINAILTPEQRRSCKQPPVTEIMFGEGSWWGL